MRAGGHRRQRRQRHVLHLASDAEITIAPIHIREIPEIALHAEHHVAQLTGLHRALHPIAGGLADAQRQVARHAVGPALAQAAAQRQHAGQAAAFAQAAAGPAVPGGVECTSGVVVGKAGVAHFQLDARCGPIGCVLRAGSGRCGQRGRPGRADAPAQLAGEMRQRHAGLLKHARQLDRAVGQHQVGPAAGFIGADDVEVGTAPAGPAKTTRIGRRCSGNRQALDAGPRLVVQRCVQRAVPARLQALHRAHRIQLAQQAAQAGTDGQALGQGGQRGQIQPVGADLTARHRVAGIGRADLQGLGLAPLQCQLAGCPGRPAIGGKAQAL